MKPRFSYTKSQPNPYDAMDALDQYVDGCSLEQKLVQLVKLRASQINGCAYCIDMHWKDLRALGESEQRLYGLDAWEESPYYSRRERAALAWTEAVTLIASSRVSDPAFAGVSGEFNEVEIADLTFVVTVINAWNRLSIASRLTPGTYKSALSS